MEFKELIKVRRSIRKYGSAPAHEELVEILREAQQAPSWKNMQTSRCYVVESPEMVDELRRLALPEHNMAKTGNTSLIVTAYVKDTVGFTAGKPDNEVGNGWGAYDLGLHDAYLALAASDAGYDTLIMGLRDGEAIRRALNVPENEVVMSVIAIGKRAQEPTIRPRKELEDVVKFF